MTTSRRAFLQASLAASAALAFTPGALARPRRKPLRILILGGTGFLGPAIVEEAQKRGHELTLFNRGRREKTKGTTFDFATRLHGNRDPDKHAEDPKPEGPKGLAEIADAIAKGAKWDAVVDTSGYYPRVVKASAELLAPAAGMYVFISTLSVYASNEKGGMDEAAPVGVMPDPTIENMGPQMSYYGPLKALCEQAAEAAFPGRTLNLRPGYIVGVRDDTDRFTYWPVRTSQGGMMLAPGTPDDPVQFIDVRDLAAFILHGIEHKTAGVMNVTGPVGGTTWGKTLDACAEASRRLTHAPAERTWVSASWLEANGPKEGFSIWIPPTGEYAGFHQRSIARAVAAGLTTRPAADTCAEILSWWPGELERRARVTQEMIDAAKARGEAPPPMANPALLRAGPSRDSEAEVLARWKERTGG
ncbi:MAG: hypothetical protein HBSAPP03_19240 [Phycisphaerae bacterium]|nr:MAG: hypothetical protein HBSAPP03_19240 [Phycisphaerae bacterium]